MENQKNQTQQLILNYGLILGFLSIVISIANYAMGKHLEPHWSSTLVSILMMFGVLGYAIYLFKQSNEGFLTIGQGIKMGVGIALVGGIISVIYTLIFITYIEPDFANQMLIFQEQKILEQYPDISDEQLENATNMTKKFTSPAMMSTFAIAGSLIFGLIVSLIISLFLKKSPENPYSN
jgi:hypothetical protein